MSCHDLSILCVTKGEDCILPLLNNLTHLRQHGIELVVACDGQDAYDKLYDWYPCDVLEKVKSKGYIESVLDQCIDLTSREYVFRIDDDESLPPQLVQWLIDGEYRSFTHWKFNRAHLWGDEKTVITNPPLYPDHQTRLSTRALSYGRTSIHCGSPFGGGELCPHPILHHKFLVKSLSERQHIRQRYNKIQPNAGESFLPFSVPEDYYSGQYDLKTLPVVEAFSAVQFQMEQIQEEIWPFAEWLWNRHPHNVLEVGVRHGGTSALWHGLSTGVVVGVDWIGQDSLGQETWKRGQELESTYPRFHSVIGDSHSIVTQQNVQLEFGNESIDFIFLDGDHSYDGVKRDFEMYSISLSRGGCIAFHDIVDTETTRRAGQGVSKFWGELKSQYPGKWKEFSTQSEWGGIGAITF